MGDDLLEDVSHLERVLVLLIDVDVATSNRGLVQMPDQDLVVEREVLESIRVQLHDRRIVHSFEQILALPRGCRRCGGRGA